MVMKPRTKIWVGLALILVGCGTHLTSIDARATLNEQRACEAIRVRAEVMPDSGAIVSLAEACFCNAGGVLKRAGQPSDNDSGANTIICP